MSRNSRNTRFARIAVTAFVPLIFGLSACSFGNDTPATSQPTIEETPTASDERVHDDQLSIITLQDEDLNTLDRLIAEDPQFFENLLSPGQQISVLTRSQEVLFKQSIVTPEMHGSINYARHKLLIDLAYTQITDEFESELDADLASILQRSIVYVSANSEVYSAFIVEDDQLNSGFGDDILGTTEQEPVWPEN